MLKTICPDEMITFSHDIASLIEFRRIHKIFIKALTLISGKK